MIFLKDYSLAFCEFYLVNIIDKCTTAKENTTVHNLGFRMAGVSMERFGEN